ncbi:hypothetical protein [Clostridium sp.]
MKRIKKVKFSNFRAFENEEFDFMGNNGETADFICIYGANGMGKSSFVDGIEWMFTGKIDRIEKEKRIVDEYNGYILKNYNSSDEKKANIKVIFEDDEYIVKEANKYISSKNDYSKGTIKPTKYKNKKLLEAEQILPHSKIDGFVQAKGPEAKYEEWGKIWDSDGTQRKIFNQIYQMRKISKTKLELIEQDCEENEKKLFDLDISSDVICELNMNINMFNKLSNRIEISQIKKEKGEKILVPSSKNISILKKQELDGQDRMQKIKNKLEFLDKYFDGYEKEINILALSNNNQKKYSKAVEQCSINKRTNDRLIQLNSDYLVKEKVLIKFNKVYNAGSKWFSLYLDYFECNENINRMNNKINIIEAEFKNINKQKIDNEELLSNIMTKITSILSKKEIALNNVKNINKIQEMEKQFQKLKNDRIKSKGEIKTSISNTKKNIEQLKLIKINEGNIHLSFKDRYEEIDINTKIIKELLEKYITLFNKTEDDFKSTSKDKEAKKREYDIAVKNYNELEILLTNAKNYIESKNISQCPICKTPFNGISKLVEKIDLSINQEQLLLVEKELKAIDNSLEECKLRKKNLITEWNSECSITLEKELKNKEKLELDWYSVINLINDYDKQINDCIYKTNECEQEIIRIGYKGKVFNAKNIISWYTEAILTFEQQKNNAEINKKKIISSLQEKQSSFQEQKNVRDTILKSINMFIKDDNNIVLEGIINEFVNIKTFQDISDRYKLLKTELFDINKEIDQLKESINKGIQVNLGKCDYYEEKANKINNDIRTSEAKLQEYTERYNKIFHNYNVSYKAIKRRKKNIDQYSDKINLKIDMLNNLIARVDIVDYEKKYDELIVKKKLLNNEVVKYKNGFLSIANLYLQLKDELEKNAGEVLNGAIVNTIYKKIEPHKVFDSLKYELNFNKEDKPELFIVSESSKNGKEISPQLFFSTAQLNTIALSIFFAGALSISDAKVKTIFIDDPIGHFDDINVLAFVDVLRSIVRNGEWQIVISTHDETFFNILQNKISSKYYNSKYIKFSSIGEITYVNG